MMPKMLGKSPFHHHHSGSGNAGSGGESGGESEAHSLGMRPGRSFLSFLGRNHSEGTESIKSQASSESIQHLGNHSQNSAESPTSPHGDGSQHRLTGSPRPSHSMAELKRFFRSPISVTLGLGSSSHHHNNHQHQHHHAKQHQYGHGIASPTISPPPFQAPDLLSHEKLDEHEKHTQSAIPPESGSSLSLSNRVNIYQDDSILAQKYGKLGKLLGAGAGGSVKVISRPTDGAMFAVKEFRARKSHESAKDYAKKCTAEFLIGSSLHHPNVIETLDIFADTKNDKYFEVMEYCPVDFFGVVMSGKMSRGEINCCLKQIVEGVRYLHGKGLAHRDLKLDNCVMNKSGILKLIDFGSAVVFRYPFEDKIVMAHGVVGSDPYLAPEVITSTKSYDPQFADVWSIAIIYCCMMLNRFPWKSPLVNTDENFRLYCMPDEIEHDYVESANNHEKLLAERAMKKKLQQQSHSKQSNLQGLPATPQQTNETEISELPPNEKVFIHPTNGTDLKSIQSHKPVTHVAHNKKVQGPYRLMRLLPHASRPIVSRMLQVNPEKRATLNEVLADPWFETIHVCTADDQKRTIRGEGHHHTVVLEEGGRTDTYKI